MLNETETTSNKSNEENNLFVCKVSPTLTESGQLIEERSLWVSRSFEEDNVSHELRERTYGWNDIHSFGYLKRCNFSTVSSQLDRHRVLELIFNHLHSIGLHSVSDSLCEESKLIFQRQDQHMERTDLRLLVSMSLGPRDNLWNVTNIENISFLGENQDIDNLSFRYYESPIYEESKFFNYQEDIVFLKEEERVFSHISEISLISLISSLVHKEEIFISFMDRQEVYSMINSICQSSHFFNHLFSIYYQFGKSKNIRENVLFIIEEWVEFSGLFIGQSTLNNIEFFVSCIEEEENSLRIKSKLSKLGYGHHIIPSEAAPSPIILDAVKLLHPNLSLAEASPEETARQITLVSHRLFSAIHPREFYFSISSRSLGPNTPGLNELYNFGRRLKRLVCTTIVSSSNFEECLHNMGIIISIANCLHKLHNYESVSWIVSCFEMSCILNLRKIFNSLPEELRQSMIYLQTHFGYKKSSEEYERLVKECQISKESSIPNIRYELSIFSRQFYGGEDFLNGRINWSRHHLIGSYILQYVCMQNIDYNFYDISQIQDVLNRESKYSRSELESKSIEIESPIKEENEHIIEESKEDPVINNSVNETEE